MPPDIEALWGNDLTLSASGDLAIVDGDDLTRERLIRRLMTIANSYLWHKTYGAGVPQRIGATLDIGVITGVITSQVRKEGTVAATPAPQITVTPILNGVSVWIKYWSATTGKQVALTFDASN